MPSSTCRTAQFTFHIVGNMADATGSTSAAFNIPALSGTGNGACSTYASSLTSKFNLGTTGAYFTFYKDWIQDATGALLYGTHI